jgi:response regulator RpfG family c-di-GMP phosphodiesterase
MLNGSPSRLLRMAAEIALTHHERWDGTGYPQTGRRRRRPGRNGCRTAPPGSGGPGRAASPACRAGGSPSRLLRMAAEIALTHHERWDGTGYPQGLKGDGLPLSIW